MKIAEFIQQEIVRKRLEDRSTLVVYDADRRYRDLCLALAGDRLRVVDASESSIESREAALAVLQEMGASTHPAVRQLLVYVPAPAPMTDEQKQRDPFSLYAEMGGCFPDPLNSGDDYLALCLKARPDHTTAIRRIFVENPNPSFDMVDAVGGGTGWPQLQALLKVDSARDILFALLAPTEAQKAALKGQDGWVTEAKSLLKTTLELRLIKKNVYLTPMSRPAGSQPPFGSSICSIPAITAKHSLSPASFTPSVVPLACAWATTFAHGTGGAYHVPLDRQLCAFRGFLSPGHATNDEMAMRQRHSLMAYLFGHGASQSCGSLAATCAVLM